jgi:hypothetical protein
MYMNAEYTTGLNMFILYDPKARAYMPLHTTNPIVVGYEGDTDIYGNPVTNTIYSNVANLYIESHYTGSPNNSGSMPLSLKTYLSDDYASSLNMYAAQQNMQGSSNLPLYIRPPIVGNLNLIVYNTNSVTGMNLYTSGAYVSAGSVNMAVSGYERPSGNMTTFIRGNYI